ncbi:hypothetical protein RB614_15235 [Phytohabitans sp. ZYX-F-186]|uniref:Uncharacterized protein n=1 Tax=Phytohabitans maris TaxID=3071409 RepID=A0ABU0ZHV0_9ACTN|nr:hypothetical protein [Phytohabitans sp. ZYX-F-186]MDQ7905870.1 hypothetical protein [Phytohabitans sp. ZYX-F-186]
MSTQKQASGGPLFVLATNNTMAHVYRDVQSLLDAREIKPDQLRSIEFFDVQGHKLVPTLSDTGALTGLRDSGSAPNVSVVQQRLYTTRANLASGVDARIARHQPRVTRDEALSNLAVLEGRSLPDCYVLLEPIFSHSYASAGPIQPRHDGSWWHNFWAH